MVEGTVREIVELPLRRTEQIVDGKFSCGSGIAYLRMVK